mmetsp:Transcript_71285/g.82930  ORF Transcript_71285/g.82930 Transcript_71285/m.82930 type:complete len:618 (+) Transcript_71285:85-1938(+)
MHRWRAPLLLTSPSPLPLRPQATATALAATLLRPFCCVRSSHLHTACVPSSDGSLLHQRRGISSASYPSPASRTPRRRSKRSDFNFLTRSPMIKVRRQRGSSVHSNRRTYRKIMHTDVAASKNHREAVRDMLLRDITLLPVDVCVEIFLGKRKGCTGPRAKWHRTVGKSRNVHPLTKDRLMVSAFSAFEKSSRFQSLMSGQQDAESGVGLTAKECRLIAASRSSWHLDGQFWSEVRNFLRGRDRLKRSLMIGVLYRNDARVPHAWDHYSPYLPVRKADILEKHEYCSERLAKLKLQTPNRRFIHKERKTALMRAALDDIQTIFHGNSTEAVSKWKQQFPASLAHMLEEQRAIAKMLFVFYTSKEAMMFSSGLTNFLQRQRLRFFFDPTFRNTEKDHGADYAFWSSSPMVRVADSPPPPSSFVVRGASFVLPLSVGRNSRSRRTTRRHAICNVSGVPPGIGVPPGLAFSKLMSKVYQSIPDEHRLPFYGIPPRFVTRPTCGFHLFVRHYRQSVRGGVTGRKTLADAQAAWRTLTPIQRAVFDFPFPVSVAQTSSDRLPFQRFLHEQTALLQPQLSRTGRRPKSFYQTVMTRWRTLSAAEKNRYDTDCDIRPMFPLVSP